MNVTELILNFNLYGKSGDLRDARFFTASANANLSQEIKLLIDRALSLGTISKDQEFALFFREDHTHSLALSTAMPHIFSLDGYVPHLVLSSAHVTKCEDSLYTVKDVFGSELAFRIQHMDRVIVIESKHNIPTEFYKDGANDQALDQVKLQHYLSAKVRMREKLPEGIYVQGMHTLFGQINDGSFDQTHSVLPLLL